MEQTEPREYFTYFRSYHIAIKMLPKETRLELYDALGDYMFEGKEPNLSKKARPYWELIKPTLDKSNKNRDNGSKGGRPKKTDGFSDSETAGTRESESNKDKEKEKDKDKEMDKDKGKGNGAKAPSRRLMKRPPAAVFESIPESSDRIGYEATENLKKKRLVELEQVAQHTTAQPPDDDAETQRLKQQFMQQLNPVPVAAPGTPPADTGTAAASTQTTAHGADQSAAPTLEAVQAPQLSHDQADPGPAGQEITAQPTPQHPPEESPAASTTPDRCQIGTT